MKTEIINTRAAQLPTGEIIVAADPSEYQWMVIQEFGYPRNYTREEMKETFRLTDEELNKIANLINPF